jgi:integrase/recombinase XerD
VLSGLYEFIALEGLIPSNPVLPILKRYKENGDGHERQLISIEEVARMIQEAPDIRDKAILAILFKTGMKRGDLIALDVSDVDLIENMIHLKPAAKRSNRTQFMDEEAIYLLRRWLRVREGVNRRKEQLCSSARGAPESTETLLSSGDGGDGECWPAQFRVRWLEDRFGPHCARHWFCTPLLRAGMSREFVKELRGDSRKEAFDLYNHIGLKELKEAYLACIPQLWI